MVAVELRNQVTVLVDKCELFRVSREHDLVNVDLKELFLLGLALRVKQNVVDRALQAAHDGLGSIFVHELWLVVHDNLFLKFQVSLAENQNLALSGNVHVSLRPNS